MNYIPQYSIVYQLVLSHLLYRAEERHKLVTASLNFYKTAEQVCSVLDSLEREYKRDDVDWSAAAGPPPAPPTSGASSTDSQADAKAAFIVQLITKHQEQKEAFLKACTLARRTAETFLKYSNRSLQYFNHASSTFRGPDAKVKGNYLINKNMVLETVVFNIIAPVMLPNS